MAGVVNSSLRFLQHLEESRDLIESDEAFVRSVSVPADVILAMISCLLVLVAISANFYCILRFVRMYRNSSERKMSAEALTLYINLCLSDLSFATFSGILSCVTLLSDRQIPISNDELRYTVCSVTGIVYFVCTRTSISTLAVICVFRVSSLTKKHGEIQFLKRKHVTLVVCVTLWICPLLLALIPLYRGVPYYYWKMFAQCEWREYHMIFGNTVTDLQKGVLSLTCYAIPFSLPGVIIIICSFRILHFLIVRKNGPTNGGTKAYSYGINTTLLLVISIFLCYLSWWINALVYVLQSVGLFDHEGVVEIVGKAAYLYQATVSSNTMLLLHSALDPLIYYYTLFNKGIKVSSSLEAGETRTSPLASNRSPKSSLENH